VVAQRPSMAAWSASDHEGGCGDSADDAGPRRVGVIDLGPYLLNHLPVERQVTVGSSRRGRRTWVRQEHVLEDQPSDTLGPFDGHDAGHQPTQRVTDDVDLSRRHAVQ